jgi:hypothetical protein
MMSQYYRAHRAELPPDTASHRELIIELIMAGLSPQEAFAMVLRSEARGPALARPGWALRAPEGRLATLRA